MCDLTQEFKLCSCDGENLPIDKIGWVLVRQDAYLNMQSVVGMRATIIQLSNYQLNVRPIIATLLNKNPCFDFEYHPSEYDFLRIRSENSSSDWYAFVFFEGKWIVDESVPLYVSKPQLDAYRNGTVYQNPNIIPNPKENYDYVPKQKKLDDLLKIQQENMALIQQKNSETSSENVIKQIKELHELYQLGILTQDEFESKKKELLAKI